MFGEPGEGTMARLYLPRSREAEDAPVEAAGGKVVGGSETILLVEDGETVRDDDGRYADGARLQRAAPQDADSALVNARPAQIAPGVAPGGVRLPALRSPSGRSACWRCR